MARTERGVLITDFDGVPAFEGTFVDADDADLDDFGLGKTDAEKNHGAEQDADDEGLNINLFHGFEIWHTARGMSIHAVRV